MTWLLLRTFDSVTLWSLTCISILTSLNIRLCGPVLEVRIAPLLIRKLRKPLERCEIKLAIKTITSIVDILLTISQAWR